MTDIDGWWVVDQRMVYSEVKPTLQRGCEGKVTCWLTLMTGQRAGVSGKDRILAKAWFNIHFG